MDCVGFLKVLFGKQTFTVITSLFDVVSDLINSLNFLGFYNISMDEKSILKKEYVYTCNLSHTVNISNSCNLTVTTGYEEREEIRQTWGIISIFLMFLPGIIGGSLIMAWTCINFTKQRDCSTFGNFSIAILLSSMFPVMFLLGQLLLLFPSFLKRNCNKRESEVIEFMVTGVAYLESSIESVGQLCLQLYTILYGYQSNWIQEIAIVASFVQIARCAILNDMDTRLFLDDTSLSFKEAAWEMILRLPTYISTIVFRISSLVLTMAYLRSFSIIPIILLICEPIGVTWVRLKNNKKLSFTEINNGLYLVFSNIGVVNTYTIFQIDRKFEEKENDTDIKNFVRKSSIITFSHHLTVLVFILIIGGNYPEALEHWSSRKFWLTPGTERFYWVFSSVILVGILSLTAILYRVRHITNFQCRKDSLKSTDKNVN